jgi:hypothetical protein
MMTEKKSLSEQKDRFTTAARELGADESEDALDRVMGSLDLKKSRDDEGKPGKRATDE